MVWGTALLAWAVVVSSTTAPLRAFALALSLDNLEVHASSGDEAKAHASLRLQTGASAGGDSDFPWHFTASLLQEGSAVVSSAATSVVSATGCRQGDTSDWCKVENLHVTVLVVFLSVAIFTVICIWSNIREDKEETITPLCPQLIVKTSKAQRIRLVLDASETGTEVVDADTDNFICRVILDWPDPLRPGFTGVAATVRIQDRQDKTLATIVARSVAVQGQGICVCRQGCEIFGFVEPDEKQKDRYNVCHRSTVQLLSLEGDLDSDVSTVRMMNSGGMPVCTIKKIGSICEGEVEQHTDAGLIICTLFAAHVHRQLLAKEMPSPWDFGGFNSTPGMPIGGSLTSPMAPRGQPRRLEAFPPSTASASMATSVASNSRATTPRGTSGGVTTVVAEEEGGSGGTSSSKAASVQEAAQEVAAAQVQEVDAVHQTEAAAADDVPQEEAGAAEEVEDPQDVEEPPEEPQERAAETPQQAEQPTTAAEKP